MEPKLLALVALRADGPSGAEGLRAGNSSSGSSTAATRRRCAITRWRDGPEHQDRAAGAHLVDALKAAPYTERLIADFTETVRGLRASGRERLCDVAFVLCFVSAGEHL